MTSERLPGAPARRLFLACWPDGTTREHMAHAGRQATRDRGGRTVPPHNLHVTLVFLGSVGEGAMPSVLAAARGLTSAPFEILFDRIEFWPRPQVIVVVPAVVPPGATMLAADLGARLAHGGLEFDPRPWRPHVTLARKVVTRPASDLAFRPVRWPVRALSLVESLTGPTGVRYAVLRRWPLAVPGSPPDPPTAADCLPA